MKTTILSLAAMNVRRFGFSIGGALALAAAGCGDGAQTGDSKLLGSDEPTSTLTLGLWHESIPSGTWQVSNLEAYLNDPGIYPNTGFADYAKDYVQYVVNLKSAVEAKGLSLGTVYFALGDPGNPDWGAALNNAYKFAEPVPGPGMRPLINELVIDPLAKAGVTDFGFVLGDIGTPWEWAPASPGAVAPPGSNPNIEKVFQLIAALNADLAQHYSAGENALYILNLGLDNEGFGEIYTPGSCPPSDTPGTVINLLWDHYIAPKTWGTTQYQWGITGASPPFVYECKEAAPPNTQHTIEQSRREFSFIEYYNVPGNNEAVLTFDHPGFVPCSSPWTGDALTTQCDQGDSHANWNVYYGLVTPSRKRTSLLSRDISSLREKIYEQPEPTLADIMVNRDPVDESFLEFIYGTINAKRTPSDVKGNLTTLSQSSAYRADPSGTRWMLSIENLSSSYAAINPAAPLPTQPPYTLAPDQVDVTSPESSIALKYRNQDPFNRDGRDGDFLLTQPHNASGSFEAFGGWELDEILDLVVYLNEQNPLLRNFMLYEFAFAKVKQAAVGAQ